MAYITEVLIREAEIYSAHIDACLFSTFIQEGWDSTQHDVSEHSKAPDVCAQGNGNTLNNFWSRKLRISKEMMNMEVACDLDGIF